MTLPKHLADEAITLLSACYAALNTTPRFRFSHPRFADSYALAEAVSNLLTSLTVARVGGKPTASDEERETYSLEINICGMRPDTDDPRSLTLADDPDDVTSWDVDLRLYLPDGVIEVLLERSYPTHKQASVSADVLTRLFPQAAINEWPE